LLPGFVSQRTRRPFKAFLTRAKDGKISFEFEERKAKPAAKGKAAAAEPADEGGAAETMVAPAKTSARKAPATKTAAKTATKAAAKKAPVKRATAAKKTTG
jgi:DNA topoisomerase-3